MTKTSDLIVRCLEEEGVEHVFGLPGEKNLDQLDSIARSDSIAFVCLPGTSRARGARPRLLFAQAHGAAGYRAESAAHLSELLKQCLGTHGVKIIDCPVDYSQDDRILNEEIKRLSAAL